MSVLMSIAVFVRRSSAVCGDSIHKYADMMHVGARMTIACDYLFVVLSVLYTRYLASTVIDTSRPQ